MKAEDAVDPGDLDPGHAADVQAIRDIRAGRIDAFGRIVDRHAPRLRCTLGRFFREPADLDDVLQESLLRAYRNLDRYDPTLPLGPWLRRIAVNVALDELRRRRRAPKVEDSQELLEAQPVVADPLRQRELAQLLEEVERVLETMPIELAAVFRLRVQDELSYAEIAQALDVPLGTVMSRLARARGRIAVRLAARFGDAPQRAGERGGEP